SDSQKDGLSFMTNDLKQIETAKTSNELMIISELIAFLLSLAVGIINSWVLTMVFMVATLVPGLVQRAFTKKIQDKSEVWEAKNASYTQSVNDGLNGAQTVDLYDAQKPTVLKVVSSAKKMEKALMSLNFTQASAGEVIMTFADIFSFILPFLVGAVLMFQGQIGAGTLVMIVQLSNEFINPIVNIFQQLNQIKSTKPMWDKVEKALRFSSSKAQQVSGGTFTGLQVEDASYSQNGHQILTDLSLTIAPNEKILLMAPSGWGKTTVLNLMLGKIKPDKGNVYINQKNVTGNWNMAHDNFSYVNQKPFIFDDTIKFNISLGREATDNELAYAVKSAGLTDLISEKGWNYQVGEKGVNLSGGQIQRIEIARALL
ncbi:ATP-binding cassette domain-containing protein, partial [Lactobacillus sp.]